jgi:AcrR family transcriptional regulator
MSLIGKTVFSLADIARARGVSKGAAFRWLTNMDMRVEIGRDSGDNPRWGTTMPLLIERVPDLWDAMKAQLLAGGRCPSCGQDVPMKGRRERAA